MLLKEYLPEKHAQEEREINEAFFRDTPASIFKHAGSVLRFVLDSWGGQESVDAFILLLSAYPMIERVLIYTYSPIEAFDFRKTCLKRWAEADSERRDLRSPQAVADAAFLIALARHSDIIRKPVLRIILEQAYSDFSKVSQADARKAAGHPDSIEELRKNWIRKEEIRDAGGEIVGIKTIRDRSPFDRTEHLDLPDRVEIHHYILNGSNPDDLFVESDAHLVEWFQWFGEIQKGNKRTWFYVHGNDEKLVKPPGAHRNPFAFNLLEKYENLIRSTANRFNLDVGLGAIILLDKVIPEWKGNVPPAAHFSKYLTWRVKDQINAELHHKLIAEDLESVPDLPSDTWTPEDELIHKDLKGRLHACIDMLEREAKNPTEKLILKIKREIIDSNGVMDNPNHQQIAKRLETETGKIVSRQYVQKMETQINARLKAMPVLKPFLKP